MNTFTYKLNSESLDKIKKFFESEGCSFSTQQYAHFKAISPNYNITFYNSCKIVIQGKEISEIVRKFCQAMNINFNIEENSDEEIKEDCYIGVDESGKGDFFGPLVIAGVAVNPQLKKLFFELGIKDSKQLSDEKILKLSKEIQKNSKWSVVVINPQKYNELYGKFKNLNKLLAWGHARTIENVLEKEPTCTLALSDKFAKDDKVIENALMVKGRQIKMVQKTKGEDDIAVAAASVIARAEFVSRVKSMSLSYKIDFPKGASDKVIQTGKEFIEKYGKQRLNEVAKLHFKTTQNL
ncbi:ribonuclease HIII [bacterium]|nr:ribonuclease HIII [bacterium]